MRVFIAVELSDEMKKPVITFMHDLKKSGITGNFVPAQNLHMTLAFIGETDDVRPIREAMDRITPEKARLIVSGCEFWDDTLVLTVKGNQKLKKLSQDIRKELKNRGISYDEQEFRPHISVIRRVKGRKLTVPAPAAEMTVTKISLMKSVLQNNRAPQYREIYSVSCR